MGADAAALAIEDRPGPGTLRHCLLEEGVQPAPGQAAVFYRGEEVLGGGTIDRVR
ncbi:MAG TPA: aminomethyltransferase beta-barrel domain-containing protein [Actinomycetota bacterium]|nr:aminomethyltransferase beta-barrel domain-containing protein [Actinomycetota bacterium]